MNAPRAELKGTAALLRTKRYGRSLDIRLETASTNDDAKAAAQAGLPDGHTVVADAQSGGRGTRGKSWSSPAGVDLYVSIVARVPVPIERRPPLTLAVGLAVLDTVEVYATGHALHIKWPNDVVLDGRKCAGILVETTSGGAQDTATILGIGLNVNRREFPPELEGRATSLVLATGQEHDRTAVLATLLERIERVVDEFVAEGPARFVARVQSYLFKRGESVRFDGRAATLVGIDQRGAVLIDTNGDVAAHLAGDLDAYAG